MGSESNQDGYFHTAGKKFVGAIATGIAGWLLYRTLGTTGNSSPPLLPQRIVLTARLALANYANAQIQLAAQNGSDLDYQELAFRVADTASTAQKLDAQSTRDAAADWSAANHALYSYDGQISNLTSASEASDSQLQSALAEVKQTLPPGLQPTTVQPSATAPTSDSDGAVTAQDDWAGDAADADMLIVTQEASLIERRDRTANDYQGKLEHLRSIGPITFENVGALRIEVDELNAQLRRENATLVALIAARHRFMSVVSGVAQHVPTPRRDRFLKPILMAETKAPRDDSLTSVIPMSRCGDPKPVSANTWHEVRQQQAQRQRQKQIEEQTKQAKVHQQEVQREQQRRTAGQRSEQHTSSAKNGGRSGK